MSCRQASFVRKRGSYRYDSKDATHSPLSCTKPSIIQGVFDRHEFRIPLLFDDFQCFFETLFPVNFQCSTTFLKRCFSRFLAIPLLFFDLGFRSIDKKQRNARTALIHHTVQNPKKKFKVCEIWKNRLVETKGLKHCFEKTLFTAANLVNLKQCFFPGIHRTHPQ
jgi:hypothetical protein